MPVSKLRNIKIRIKNEIEYQAVLRALFDDGCYWNGSGRRTVDSYANELGFYVNSEGAVQTFMTEDGFKNETIAKEVYFSLQATAFIQDPVRSSVRIGSKLYDVDQINALIEENDVEPVDY